MRRPVRPDMPLLYYIRHGETDWNAARRLQGQRDVALNAVGRRQAAICADILRGRFAADGRTPADYHYVSSPLVRASETMALMRASLGLGDDFARDPRLKELSFGQWEGLTFREVRAVAPALLATRERDKWRFAPPGGESYEQLLIRVGAWLATLERDTVVVAHGGTMRALIVALGVAGPDAALRADIDQGVVYRLADGQMTEFSAVEAPARTSPETTGTVLL